MAASIDDLLTEAQSAVWRLAGDAPQVTRGRERITASEVTVLRQWHGRQAAAQLAAWPLLAASGARALRVGGTWEQPIANNVLGVLSSAQTPGEVDPHLQRAARCLGAAADLMVGRATTDVEALPLRDRIGSILEGAARMTAAHAANTTKAGLALVQQERALTALVQEIMQARLVPPSQRHTLLQDVAVPAPGERTLDAEVMDWTRAAGQVLRPAAAAESSIAMRLVAADIAVIQRTAMTLLQVHAPEGASSAETVRGVMASATQWARVASDWPDWLRSGGAPGIESRAASLRLREVCAPLVSGARLPLNAPSYPGPGASQALGRRLIRGAAIVGSRYLETLETLARSELLTGPAQTVVRDIARDPARSVDDNRDTLNAAAMQAASRGRWTTVPAQAPTIRALLETANLANQSGIQARQLITADLTSPSDKRSLAREAVSARLATKHPDTRVRMAPEEVVERRRRHTR